MCFKKKPGLIGYPSTVYCLNDEYLAADVVVAAATAAVAVAESISCEYLHLMNQ